MVKDCFGNVAAVGDEIAFSMGNAGAKEWLTATITRVTEKCVYFEGRPGDNWRWKETTELRRTAGAFVINKKELESKSNAWDKLSGHIKDIDGAAGDLRDSISEELSKGGCDSAWVHRFRFVEVLANHYEESIDG